MSSWPVMTTLILNYFNINISFDLVIYCLISVFRFVRFPLFVCVCMCNVYMCVCMCVYVCMYVCMLYVCIHVCIPLTTFQHNCAGKVKKKISSSKPITLGDEIDSEISLGPHIGPLLACCRSRTWWAWCTPVWEPLIRLGHLQSPRKVCSTQLCG